VTKLLSTDLIPFEGILLTQNPKKLSTK